MYDKNQSRPGGGTPERHMKSIDQNNHPTPAANCQLLDLIPVGPEKAISARQLTRLTGARGREITEEARTWAGWRDAGFMVRHGSKALFAAELIHGGRGDGAVYRASFFGASQVEPITVTA